MPKVELKELTFLDGLILYEAQEILFTNSMLATFDVGDVKDHVIEIELHMSHDNIDILFIVPVEGPDETTSVLTTMNFDNLLKSMFGHDEFDTLYFTMKHTYEMRFGKKHDFFWWWSSY